MEGKELIQSVIGLAEIDPANEEVKTFFDSIADFNVPVPAVVAEAFTKNILNRKAAMRDPQVVKEISSAREKENRQSIQAILPNFGFESEELLPIFEDGGKPHDINTVYNNVLSALSAKERANSQKTESEQMKDLKTLTRKQVEEAERQVLALQANYATLQKEMAKKEDLSKISRGFDKLGIQMTPDLERVSGIIAMEQLEKNGYYLQDGDTGIELWQKVEDGVVRKPPKADGGVLGFNDLLNDVAKRLGASPKTGVPNNPAPPAPVNDSNPVRPSNVTELYPSGPTGLETAMTRGGR